MGAKRIEKDSLVSVIIPTYKGVNSLKRAIDSVLDQSYENYELIVIDDNNPDTIERQETEKLMLEYSNYDKVKYYKHCRNMNGATARNTGIKKAKGDIITFLDDDDYLLKHRVESSILYLINNPEFIGVITGVNIVDEDETLFQKNIPAENLSIESLLLNEMAIGTGSNIFLKKEIYEKTKGFDESFIRRQDIEFMIRACREGTIGFISKICIVKGNNGTLNHPTYMKMKNVIENFTLKFKSEITLLSDESKVRFYENQYNILLLIALYERNYNNIKDAESLLKKYAKLSMKQKVLIFLYINNLRDNAIISYFIKLGKRLKSKYI